MTVSTMLPSSMIIPKYIGLLHEIQSEVVDIFGKFKAWIETQNN